MAHLVIVGNQTFKRRSPTAVWIGLPLITLGIYNLAWWYKINNEARRYLGDQSIKPGISLLAVTFGAILLVPPFLSIYRTAERVRRMQQRAGLPGEDLASPWIALILAFVFGLHSLYLQVQLNKIWDRQEALANSTAVATT
jgi:hypothetical protein